MIFAAKTPIVFIVSLLLLAYASPTAWAQKDKKDVKGKKDETPRFDLKIKWQEGQNLRYLYKFSSKTHQNNMGMMQEMQNFTDKVYAFKVESVDNNGLARVSATLESAKISIRHPVLGQVTYNSKNPPTEIDPMVRAEHFLVGKTFYAFIEATGKVKELEGAQQIIAMAFREAKYTKDEEQTESQLKQKITPEHFTELLEMVFRARPETEVALNESWNQTVSRDQGVSYIADYKFTLTESTGSKISAIIQGDFRPNTEAKGMPIHGGMQTKYALRGREMGSLELDPATNILKVRSSNQNLSGSVVVTGGAVGFMEMPVMMDVSIQVEQSF